MVTKEKVILPGQDWMLGAEMQPLSFWFKRLGVSQSESNITITGIWELHAAVQGILSATGFFRMGVSGDKGQYIPHLTISINGHATKTQKDQIEERFRQFRRIREGEVCNADLRYGELPIAEANYIGTVGLTREEALALDRLNRSRQRKKTKPVFDPEQARTGY